FVRTEVQICSGSCVDSILVLPWPAFMSFPSARCPHLWIEARMTSTQFSTECACRPRKARNHPHQWTNVWKSHPCRLWTSLFTAAVNNSVHDARHPLFAVRSHAGRRCVTCVTCGGGAPFPV